MKIYFKEKIVGEVFNEIYKTPRKPIHFMMKFQGFGISRTILNQLADLNVVIIEINYFGANGEKTYRFYLQQYINSALIYVDKDDEQLFVPVSEAMMPVTNSNI